MTTALARTIQKDIHEGVRIEYLVVAGVTTLKPGHLVKIVNVSGVSRFNVQATAGGDDPVILLHEDKFQGDATTTGGVDKAYAASDPAFAEYPPRGVLRYVRVATGEVLVKGDQLVYNGAAALIKTTGSPLRIVATAEEAITADGEQLVLVRIA